MRTLYLDTSDLSYLLKGRGPAHGGDWVAHRARLESLLREGRVQLLISFVHLGEIALDPETKDAALDWLDAGVPVFGFTTTADAIFRAELLGDFPCVEARPFTRTDAEQLKLATTVPGLKVAGAMLARGVKGIVDLAAWADNFGKRAARPPKGSDRRAHMAKTAASERIADRILRGDTVGLPAPVRALAAAALAATPALLARSNLTLEDVVASRRLKRSGRSWIIGLVERERVAEAEQTARDPARAPACALRVAIDECERRDPARKTRSSTLYDVMHLAYATRCDIATIDGFNFRATEKVRTKLVRPKLFEVGNLGSVLDEAERE
jgi:hypothetical protein